MYALSVIELCIYLSADEIVYGTHPLPDYIEINGPHFKAQFVSAVMRVDGHQIPYSLGRKLGAAARIRRNRT
ncbi:hypothetical protein DP091_15240 [Paenibacillus sp. MDMC362]|nr:hypothetical protein DP091_15240 [Paenibacillus sp. MDMC362]